MRQFVEVVYRYANRNCLEFQQVVVGPLRVGVSNQPGSGRCRRPEPEQGHPMRAEAVAATFHSEF